LKAVIREEKSVRTFGIGIGALSPLLLRPKSKVLVDPGTFALLNDPSAQRMKPITVPFTEA
jgi:hypothetical protein